MRNGAIYEPQTPGSPISGSVFSSLPGLLPSPVASFSQNTPENHLRKKPGRSRVTDLKILVEHGLLASGGQLLKTPTAQLGSNGGSQHPDKRRAGGHGPTLADQVEWLPLEPGGIIDWGPYAQAILRHQQVIGRMVPHPLEPGKNRGVLSVSFVEWLMDRPEGSITGVPGLNREAVFRILGNGVVTRQALLGVSLMWDAYLEATSLA